MASRTLIQNGLVIDTEPTPTVLGRRDVLVEDGLIAAVGTNLPVTDCEVVDAANRIVMPGFVDTHRHTWQAGLRSVAPDSSFSGYFERVLGRLAPRYRPEDVYASNLAGALECLDSGITTLVDWSHIQHTPAHTDAAIQALRASGIRAVFAYAGDLTQEAPRVRSLTGGLVTMAIAAMGPEIAGSEQAMIEWRTARDLDVPISVHMGGFGAESAEQGLTFLRENNLLWPGINIVHANHYTDEAYKRLTDSGFTFSITPTAEIALGMGHPATGPARRHGAPTGLGVDAVTYGPGDMFSLMRATYWLERARSPFTVHDVLRMATIEGAEAAGLGNVTGSLRIGKQADLLLLRTDTLATAPAHDPIATVVLSADTSAVDTVLVAGRLTKHQGRLVNTGLAVIADHLAQSAEHLVPQEERQPQAAM